MSDISLRVSAFCTEVCNDVLSSGGTITCKELKDRVVAKFGVPSSMGQVLVQVFTQSTNEFHVEKGPKGGIKLGSASDRVPRAKKDSCPLCGTGLREGRFAAVMELLKENPTIERALAANPDLSKRLAKLVKEHSHDDSEETTPPADASTSSDSASA